jgi:putative SOS response-associated peptidase YedK
LIGAAAVVTLAVMCGRMVHRSSAAEVARLFATRGGLPNYQASYNVAPTQLAPVVRWHAESGERRLDLLSWGLVPHWTKDPVHARRPINARAETVATNGLFRGAFARRRAIIPADAYYEWQARPDGKQPYAVAREDGQMLALAGLWESYTRADGEVLRSFAVITVLAGQDLTWLHDRAPAVLEPDAWTAWLSAEPDEAQRLLQPPAHGLLRAWPVSRRVNAVRNDGAELLATIA